MKGPPRIVGYECGRRDKNAHGASEDASFGVSRILRLGERRTHCDVCTNREESREREREDPPRGCHPLCERRRMKSHSRVMEPARGSLTIIFLQETYSVFLREESSERTSLTSSPPCGEKKGSNDRACVKDTRRQMEHRDTRDRNVIISFRRPFDRNNILDRHVEHVSYQPAREKGIKIDDERYAGE